MKRGSVIIAADRGEFTTKPRPYVIVQLDASIADSLTLTVCPLTSGLIGAGPVRVPVKADSLNGLADDSEIEVGRVTSIRKRRVRQMAGALSAEVMRDLDLALKRWLDL